MRRLMRRGAQHAAAFQLLLQIEFSMNLPARFRQRKTGSRRRDVPKVLHACRSGQNQFSVKAWFLFTGGGGVRSSRVTPQMDMDEESFCRRNSVWAQRRTSYTIYTFLHQTGWRFESETGWFRGVTSSVSPTPLSLVTREVLLYLTQLQLLNCPVWIWTGLPKQSPQRSGLQSLQSKDKATQL